MKTNLERGNMMKRKNGFTLIELLAVIVILAIIALIAVPVVMNIINRANKSAFKDSAYGLLKAGELFYTDQLLENAGLMIDKTFNFPDDIDGLEFKGSKPSDGTMTVRKDGKVSMAITNGKHCVTKGFEDEDVTITDDVTNCELGPKVNTLSTLARTETFTKVDGTNEETVTKPACITNKTKCSAGTPIAVEVAPNLVYKFYVINDDTTKNEVILIMDRNLGETVAWVSLDDYKKAGGSEADYGQSGNNNKGPLTALRVLKERTKDWKNIPAYTYTLENDADGLGGGNTYAPITKSTTATTGESVVESVRARLPRRAELTTAETGCAASSNSCKSWLYENLYNTGDNNTYGYWTSTTYSTNANNAWYVHFNGYVYNMNVPIAGFQGLRPVITLSK